MKNADTKAVAFWNGSLATRAAKTFVVHSIRQLAGRIAPLEDGPLRNRWFLGIGVVLFLVGAALFLGGGTHPIGAAYLGLMGLALIAAGFLAGGRYGKELEEPPTGFVPTGERFVDPTSRKTVEVWQDPESGQRVYVALRKDRR